MKATTKIFSLVTLLSLLFITYYACTQENTDLADKKKSKNTNTKNAKKSKKTTETPTFSVKFLEAVGPVTKGKAVDFGWKEDGKPKQFSQITKGKVVFLNFWATWCGPCKKEIPDIIQIANDLKDKNFIVIGIAVDQGENHEAVAEKIKKFGETNKMNYINFIPKQDIVTAYGKIPGIPTTFIIDTDGNIAEKIVGAQSKDEFMKAINRVLK